MTDEESIRRLLALFIQLRDDKRFTEWAELFVPEATFSYGPHALQGRAAIRDHVSELLASDRGKHLGANVLMDLDGDRATVVSDFVKLDPDPDRGPMGMQVTVTGRYRDRLVRTADGWRFLERRVEILGA